MKRQVFDGIGNIALAAFFSVGNVFVIMRAANTIDDITVRVVVVGFSIFLWLLTFALAVSGVAAIVTGVRK